MLDITRDIQSLITFRRRSGECVSTDAEEFLDDVKSKVITAIDNVRQEVEAQRAQEQAVQA